MIPELGHFALILALCMALVQTILPLVGAARGKLGWVILATPAARAQCLFMSLAFGLLTYSFIVNDFSLAYVANNSNSSLPLQYRISAVWGAHEGSLLLWAQILSFWTVAVTIFSRSLTLIFRGRVIAIMGLVSTGFILFMLATSNPFARLFPVPVDGGDLNPLLQDPGLIIHPPMLYTGYVGFSVVFAFAVAALLGGQLDSAWARWSRPWTVVAWVFLSLGITLGSWWAYYELGWGGWWFWDPVENASFMPWLVGTALIHSLAATEKRGVFKNWTVLLAICAFALSLLGTFLVRSGVLTSVHAFATDPARGVFILALLVIYIGGALTLYAWRAPGMAKGNSFELVSKETFLLINSVCLTIAMATVLLGTVYPIFTEAFSLGKISVGAPYFNTVFIPLMLPSAVFMAFGVMARWRADTVARLWQQLKYICIGSLVVGALLTFMLMEQVFIYTALAVILSLWITAATLLAVYERLRHQPGLSGLSTGFIGMSLAHIGFAISIIGISMTSYYSSETHTRIGLGDSVKLAGYEFQLEQLRDVSGPNYQATEAVVQVLRDGKQITTLHSQKRMYPVRGMPMTEAGIDAGLFRDLYFSLGEALDNKDWSVRIYYRPFVRWIWLGGLFMVVGGLLAAADRRYRLSVRRKATQFAGNGVMPGVAS
ncbi:MAG: cytochrome c-type biosis protein CcmF [Gammaproteobacteria bacterium]|nr:cytochrome c-type biosis protein CcmF [Gammaproteobacteria bacterium]